MIFGKKEAKKTYMQDEPVNQCFYLKYATLPEVEKTLLLTKAVQNNSLLPI